jgi:hypothetical protein
MASSPVTAVAGDTSDQFMAPNGQLVTVTVKSPVPTQTFNAYPIAQGQDPLVYFKQKIASTGSGSTVYIPKATYNFLPVNCTNKSSSSYNGQYLLIDSKNDFVIDGQGSTLNFVSDCPGVVINNSTRVTFRNFIIDWPNLKNAAVGSVVAVGGAGPSGYTYNLQVPVANIVAGGFDAATAWDSVNNYWSLPNATTDFLTSTTSPYMFSPAGLATNVPSGSTQLTVGQSMLVRHLGNNVALTVWSSQDVTLDTVTVNNSPSIGYLIGLGRGLHMTGCHVDRSNGRPISTNIDAIHFGSFGGDIIIENSSFAYQGDDGLNIHTAMLPVASLPSCPSPTANCQSQLPAGLYAQNGDVIGVFSSWMRLMSMQTAACTGGVCTTNIASIAANGGFVGDMNLVNARYIVQNNSFGYNRGRGFTVQTPYGLVRNNSFTGQSKFPIYLVTSSAADEGPGAQDVLFLNNQFSSPGVGGGRGAVTLANENSSGIIYDSTPASGGHPFYPGVQQNIVFAGNSFSNIPWAAFYVSSANNVILYKNTLGNTNLYTSYLTPNINAPVAIYDASNILLSGNTATVNGHALGPNYSLVVSDATSAKITVQ